MYNRITGEGRDYDISRKYWKALRILADTPLGQRPQPDEDGFTDVYGWLKEQGMYFDAVKNEWLPIS